MALADFLRCALCRGLACRPILQSCGHLFCAQCFSSVGLKQRCPACGVTTEPVAPYANAFLQRIIEAYSSGQGSALYTDSISQSFSSSRGSDVHAKGNFATDMDESFICSSAGDEEHGEGEVRVLTGGADGIGELGGADKANKADKVSGKRRDRAVPQPSDGVDSADLNSQLIQRLENDEKAPKSEQNWAFYEANAANTALNQQSLSVASATVFELGNVQPVTQFGRYAQTIPQEAVRQLLVSYGLNRRDVLRHGLASQRKLLFLVLRLGVADNSSMDERERLRELLKQPFWRRKNQFAVQ